ncbi:MAG: succinate dehydrogenase cytochrome b subunit [Acidimicrobiaceae bacterium]|nr:succinate dehydrogenase cytochrome b subunit [Acidimicrobiaceae bacterium]MCY4174849.1 succinate dehydrogenase cytochrome b subunit [Acidimicrobiaceae bacterium]MCY4281020.1 succinate dehydrogenase cytochrome b subunit [Acidimicrobiaceae bacterium]
MKTVASPTPAAAAAPAAAERVPPLRSRRRELPWPLSIYQTAVGKKYVMAATGIGLLGFVVTHMIGNLHLYEGPAQLNEYAEALRDLGGHLVPRTLILWLMRVGLLAMFVLHIHSAWSLKEISRRSSPRAGLISGSKRYAGGQDYASADFAGRTMRWTGPIIGLYVLFHLADLTWGWWLGDDYVRGDVYNNVVESLSSIPVALVYIVANAALSLHIYHGIWSAFQTLGVNNPRFNHLRRGLAAVVAATILAGNLSFPIMVQAGVVA